MVLNVEKRARLAEVLSVRDNATAKAGASARSASPASPNAPLAPSIQTTPTPASPQATPAPASPQATPAPTSQVPIAAVPLATARASPPPSPLEKNKGGVLITSDDDEDTMEGPAFKRRKTTMVATSHSSSARRPASLRDNPPSSTSPPNLLALKDGAESAPEPAPAPAPEVPLVLQQILRGYQKGAMGSSTNEALQESMALSLGEFFARANSSSHENKMKTKEQQALADELSRVKEQQANQAQRFFIRETALTQGLGILRKAELEANKRLHDEGQKYTTLLSKVVPLRAEVVGLKEEVAANQL